jgi:elongation factor P--beta-lysine ligase
MASLLEQELTTEQVQWLIKHREHTEAKKLMVLARVANWDHSKEERHEIFKAGLELFKTWWKLNNHSAA